MKRDWFLYIIETENGSLYTGITKDLKRRLNEHESGEKGAKFFRRSPAKAMRFSMAKLTQSMALRLEYAIKQLDRQEKIRLIEAGDPALFKALLKKKRKK